MNGLHQLNPACLNFRGKISSGKPSSPSRTPLQDGPSQFQGARVSHLSCGPSIALCEWLPTVFYFNRPLIQSRAAFCQLSGHLPQLLSKLKFFSARPTEPQSTSRLRHSLPFKLGYFKYTNSGGWFLVCLSGVCLLFLLLLFCSLKLLPLGGELAGFVLTLWLAG